MRQASDGFAGLSTIGQIFVNVKDLARATTHYRDALGLRFLFDAPGMAFFDAGGVRLLLGRAEKPELDHPASILYYRVDNIMEAHRALVDRGVEFITTPHVVHRTPRYDLWLADFTDSEGNVLALMSEVATDTE